MTKNKKVSIPWYDGTTRLVPNMTLVRLTKSGNVAWVTEGGYKFGTDSTMYLYRWDAALVSETVCVVYMKAPDPEPYIELPTRVGAVIDGAPQGHVSYLPYVRAFHAWVDCEGDMLLDNDVRDALINGAKVVHEGYES